MTRRGFTNGLMTGVFSLAGWVAIVFIFLIFLFTFKEALPALDLKTLRAFFLADPPVWQPTSDIPKLSFLPIILGKIGRAHV